MSEIERLMPVSYRRLLELQQLVEAYGKGDTTVMSQIIGLQVTILISVISETVLVKVFYLTVIVSFHLARWSNVFQG